MERTLQGQLSMLPIPRLSTVLRVNVRLSDTPGVLDATGRLILGWWNRKAESYGVRIEPGQASLTFAQNRFKAEFAAEHEMFALAMEEPDADLRTDREWICDLGLRRVDDGPQLELRLSYRQPYSATVRPHPRAPKFLQDIVATAGAMDVEPLSSGFRVVDSGQVDPFITLLFSEQRKLPVIAVSEDAQLVLTGSTQSRARLLAAALAKTLAGAAHVFYLTPHACWRLSDNLTQDWSVSRGAVRCYSANMLWTDDKIRHRLWMSRDISRADAAQRDGFLNVCASHIFTQVTAHFESVPLLLPSLIRRQASAALVETNVEQEAPFALSEPKQKPKQMPFDGTVRTVPNAGIAAEPPSELISESAKENEELRSLIADLQRRLLAQEELATTREREAKDQTAQLEQERAGRAEDARARQDAEDTRWLHEEEIRELKERDQLLRGASSESSEPLRPLWQNLSSLVGSMQQVAVQFRRFESDSANLLEALEEKDRLEGLNAALKAKADSLEAATISANAAEPETDVISRASVQQIFANLVPKPTLEAILRGFGMLYGDRCEVLDSAFSSARDSVDFRPTGKAFDLLQKLLTEYWEAMQAGKGDVVAKASFGTDSYAAKESSSLSNQGRKRRTFAFRGDPLLMEKHLKIGTADNSTDTLRIHFEWINDCGKIVVGHCGRHLDF